MNRLLSALLLGLPLSLLIGCPEGDDDDSSVIDDDDDTTFVEFAISSPDMVEPYFTVPDNRACEQALPVANSCDGPNPEIDWEGVPAGTVSLALIFDDPTAGGFDHWAIFNISPLEERLARGISGRNVTNDPPGDAVELENGFGWDGYLGSCPGGVNRYSWRLYALNRELATSIDTYADLEDQASDPDNLIEMVEMCHVFDGAEIPPG